MSAPTRDLDIVLLGATGFVGELTAAHLRDHAPEGTRIAIAGRSRARLDALAERLGGAAGGWERVVLDTSDRAGCDAVAARTRVLATTVGPYARYGREVIRACAEAGTHYCDLSGEVLFVRDSADGLHEVARRTGARLVNSCGFDSIPSDLGVWLTARTAKGDGTGELTRTVLSVRSMKGGFSGGTIDSMRQQVIAARSDSTARKTVDDPYGLSPDRSAEPSSSPRREQAPSGLVSRVTRRLPVRRDQTGRWSGPFVMAAYNTRIVRRSNALLDYAYGRDFRYSESVDFGDSLLSPVRATGMTAGLLGALAGMSFGPTRAVLDRVLPKPGDGPDEQARERGRFAMRIDATTTSGARYRTTVAAPYDPGYGGTAIMLGQSALCLAHDELSSEGGVLTPAVAMAEPLIERLRGFDFTIDCARVEDSAAADASGPQTSPGAKGD